MVSINYATREVSCKIVYYGPGLSGKTTNLQYVHQKVPPSTKGKLISLATDADRTLYFDFLPINIGAINGFAAKFQLYTVPGQVYYNATRKLVLRGVDGLVFVADSQPDKMDENIESLNNLKENLAEYGYDLDEIPIVIQYNKQDLPAVLSPDDLRPVLNRTGWPEFKASATEGFGVFDTLKCILKLVLDKAKTGGVSPSQRSVPSVSAPVQPVPTAVESQPEVRMPAARETVVPHPYEEKPAQPVREPVLETVGQGAVAESTESDGDEYPKATAEANLENPAPQPSPVADIRPVYRPFPGNTREDEEQMSRPSPGTRASTDYVSMSDQIRKPRAEQTAASAGQSDRDKPYAVPESPRMAPPLKAETARKKRSFFKRLFGLK